MSGTWRIGLTLAGLIATNLAITFALCRLEATSRSQIILSIIFGQALLLSVWLSLGGGKWHYRLVVAVCCIALIGTSVKLGIGNSPERLQYSFLLGESPKFFGLALLALLLLQAFLLLPLRRFRGWLITCNPTAAPTASLRFRLSDVLFWTMALAAALGVARSAAASHIDGIRRGTEVVAVFTVLIPGILAPVQWPALLATFAEARRLRCLAVLAGWTLLYCCGLIALFDYQQPWRSLDYFLRQVSETFQILGVALAVVLLNGFAIRATGCRLIRPHNQRIGREPNIACSSSRNELSKYGGLLA